MNELDPRENPHWISDSFDLREVLTRDVLKSTLEDISEERDVVFYDEEKPVTVDLLEGKGSAAARVVNGAIKKTKNRNSSERSQAISVSQRYISTAKEAQARADISCKILYTLHEKLRHAEDSEVAGLFLYADDEESADYIEALGVFAMQLDRTKKLQTEDGRGFVDFLNKAIDIEDGETIKAFVEAADVNSRKRLSAFQAQESDFAYFLHGLLGNSEVRR